MRWKSTSSDELSLYVDYTKEKKKQKKKNGDLGGRERAPVYREHRKT